MHCTPSITWKTIALPVGQQRDSKIDFLELQGSKASWTVPSWKLEAKNGIFGGVLSQRQDS